MVGTQGTVGTQYWLHNTNSSLPYAGTSGAASFDPMQFSAVAPTATTLQNYSTEASTGTAGRNLTTSSNPSFPSGTATPATTAQWQYQVTNINGMKFAASGYVYLDFWAMPADGVSTESLSFEGMVGYGAFNSKKGTYSWQSEGSGVSVTPAVGCGSWREFVIAMQLPAAQNKNSTFSTFSASNNDIIEALLFNTGSNPVRIAYDTTTYQSNVLWPQQ
jgi:hypothetical protein